MAVYTGNGSDNTINGSLFDDDIDGNGGSDYLYGLDGNDFIDGGIGDDFLFGGVGDDILVGGKGADVMDGGDGADEFRGGKGIDTVDYSTSTSAVLAYLDANTSGDAAAGDSYINVENVIGSAFNDYLQNAKGGDAFGGSGADMIYGGGTNGGTDEGGRIRGDAGVDTLNMMYGNTTAWLQNGQGYDIVNEFIENQDNFFIDLSDFGLGATFDANELVNSNSHTAVGGNAQFIYDGDDSRLYFDSNGTGAGGQILIADLTGSTVLFGTLDTGDFEYQV
jgi:Ca2+-binding RTX toxin-like protein